MALCLLRLPARLLQAWNALDHGVVVAAIEDGNVLVLADGQRLALVPAPAGTLGLAEPGASTLVPIAMSQRTVGSYARPAPATKTVSELTQADLDPTQRSTRLGWRLAHGKDPRTCPVLRRTVRAAFDTKKSWSVRKLAAFIGVQQRDVCAALPAIAVRTPSGRWQLRV